MTLRSWTTERRHVKYLKAKTDNTCFLCRAVPLYEFGHWKIVNNDYPYDRIAGTSHILTLKRHAPEDRLTSAEKIEVSKLRPGQIAATYDLIVENTQHRKSIPGHHHLHLLTMKPDQISPIMNRLAHWHTLKMIATLRAYGRTLMGSLDARKMQYYWQKMIKI